MRGFRKSGAVSTLTNSAARNPQQAIQQEFARDMANSAQARKRARQASAARLHNAGQRSAFRTAVKKVLKAIEAGDKAAAAETLKSSTSIIDRIADKGIFHKNKAARHKSRLSAAIKAMA